MEKKEEIYPKIKKERRLLAHVPDPLLVRKKTDRRGGIDYELGKRY